MQEMDITRLMDLDARAVESVRMYPRKRSAFARLSVHPGRPFVAVVGPRGSGKTVLLRQMRSETSDSFYLAVDTLHPGDRLSEAVHLLADRYRIRSFFLDEVHFAGDYARDLKELYDFTNLRIWLTSSVALSLFSSAWDLSRRVSLQRIGPFSFREYLGFVVGLALEGLPIDQILREEIPAAHLRTIGHFADYLRGGLYPFMMENGASLEQFGAILEKVITDDIPAQDRHIRVADLPEMRKLVAFVGRSSVDGINYSTAGSNVGITKYKAEKFIDLLERSFILRRVFPEGTNVLREPKVLMEIPYRLLYRPYDESIGGLREDFFALAMEQHGRLFSYAKTTRGGKTPDFVIRSGEETVVLEVGGRGKGRSQFKGVEYDRKLVLSHAADARWAPGIRAPLHCLGFPPDEVSIR